MDNLQQQKKERITLASEKQRRAADPSVSVWVEASAGTGKTKVLSDRVLRLLLNGVNPARILCLTYTKAAAVEMSNRIAGRLSGWAVAADDKLVPELEQLLGTKLGSSAEAADILAQARRLFAVLLDTPGGIKIQTIHSFCQEILKRFPLEAGISPYFEIMDDRESNEALEKIKLEILRGQIAPDTAEALSWLTASVSESTFPKILQSVTEQRSSIEEYLQKYRNPDEMIDHAAVILGITPQTTAEELRNNFWQNLIDDDIKLLTAAFEAGTETSRKYAATLKTTVNDKDFASLCKLLLSNKKLLVQKSCQMFPEAEACLNRQKQLLSETADKIKAADLLQATRAVLTLTAEILERYRQYKKHRSKMDYNDLIMLTRRLLEAPRVAEWVLYKLDGGIDNVLIDEAQDTSPSQWAIIKALTNEFFSGSGVKNSRPTVFVVGDRKQSIFSFQGADPREFEKMRNYFFNRDASFREVDMEVSFRSTAAVLDVVNAVFAGGKARQGVVRPEQKLAHIPSRIGDGGRIELWPPVAAEAADNADKIWLPPVERITAVSPSARLAQQIAENIKAKVSRGELLKSKSRPLQYRDFLILVQRRNSFVEELVRACKNAGVNIAGVDRIKLLEQISVNDLLALAEFTLLPDDDLTLACLLKSPLFGLDDQDLFTLCYNRGSTSLWQRLRQNAGYTAVAEELQSLLILAAGKRPFEFFTHVLSNLNGRRKFIERLGFECEDALDEFINLCLDFEREHIPSMQLFVGWMRQDDVEIKRNLEQDNQDAVRIMTVHTSKGLQAPIVILPDTVRVKAVKQEAGWLKDKDVLFYPLGKDYYENRAARLKEEEKELSLEEYHRLLYVALTRAEECLCICGWQQKNKPGEESWYEICKSAFEPLAEKQADGKLVYEVSQQIVPPSTATKTPAPAKAEIPSWLTNCPPDEGPLAKPLTPSHQDETGIATVSPLQTNDNIRLYGRGRIIHKLLQFLPAIPVDERECRTTEFLQNQAAETPENERRKIADEVLLLVNNPQFAPLFGVDSVAEVSLMGQVGDHIISGQIDRLVVCPDKVMIVDYKTNRPAAESPDSVPGAYLKQMRAYRELVKKIYPDKNIETYILWTNTAKIMKIE